MVMNKPVLANQAATPSVGLMPSLKVAIYEHSMQALLGTRVLLLRQHL